MNFSTLTALILASAISVLGAQAPLALDSVIDEVTVHPGIARVSRVATLPTGDGTYLIRGLPMAADRSSFRVRLERGAVGSLEVTDEVVERPDPEGAAPLEAKIEALTLAIREARDSLAVNRTLRQSVSTMLELTESEGQANLREGRPDPEAWRSTLRFVSEELAQLNESDRELEGTLRKLEEDLADTERELAELRATETKTTERVARVKVLGATGKLYLTYRVPNAGWEPVYDLRADERAKSAELVYRAKVWQTSGEAWNDARVTLSTARPRVGARGPELALSWLGLVAKPQYRGPADKVPGPTLGAGPRLEGAMAGLSNKVPMAGVPIVTEAAVTQEGPVVSFRLPSAETIPSRREPTQVLIGRARLAMDPEHVCIPAIDTTVWLRGVTKNTSPYVMLAGEASVFLGSSFIGNARFDHVRKGEEFTLHLGADEGVSVTRTRLARNEGASGVFHKRVELDTRWRIEVSNHSGLATAKGGLRMIVHETIPKSAHEDLEIVVTSVTPEFSTSERWDALAEEKGAGTWDFLLGRGESRVLEIATRMRHPAKTYVTQR